MAAGDNREQATWFLQIQSKIKLGFSTDDASRCLQPVNVPQTESERKSQVTAG